MLFVLGDDGVIHVHETVEDVVDQVEALDAEETLRAVFDETGQTYAIEWIRPNGDGRLLGFLRWVENGRYTLRPTGKRDVAEFLRALASAEYIEPSELGDYVREIQARLTRGGTLQQGLP